MPKCTKCSNQANATGVLCDECMMKGATPTGEPMVAQAPPPQQAPLKVQIPTYTDEDNDEFDRFDKDFDDGVTIRITINYTKNFSEITVLHCGSTVESKAYDDKEVFDNALKDTINKLETKAKLKKELEEERKAYFESVKTSVNDLGFSRV